MTRITLALDAMGGDHAPTVVVKGAEIARERFPFVDFAFFGPEPQIQPLLAKAPKLAKVATVHHTDVVVAADARPSVALRAGRGSSMRLALDAVAAGQARAAVSAGNTGALMAMAKFALRTLPGIDRPAIASFFPTARGESVMLDLGANVICDARNLTQFAFLGEAFARTVLGLSRPSVGLLNVGAEDQKGREELKEAAQMLRDSQLNAQFLGFVEGDDIAAGRVDVIVTDGFTGNVALKTAEGTARLISGFLKESFRASLLARLGYVFARPAFGKFRERIDPRRYNGAIFLGLNGIAVKSHGGTDALGFANAIGVAVDMVVHGFLDRIRADLAHAPSSPQPAVAE
ncbi:MAG: phosphate acyltransferase PlsX [Alphaproteobacteria bacterium]|nr:phosphate acyltransferase PlsX [Alphaproteobacteria bacterium]